MQNYSYENEFHLLVHFHANQIHFHLNGFARIRIETEAKGNSELKWPILF